MHYGSCYSGTSLQNLGPTVSWADENLDIWNVCHVNIHLPSTVPTSGLFTRYCTSHHTTTSRNITNFYNTGEIRIWRNCWLIFAESWGDESLAVRVHFQNIYDRYIKTFIPSFISMMWYKQTIHIHRCIILMQSVYSSIIRQWIWIAWKQSICG